MLSAINPTSRLSAHLAQPDLFATKVICSILENDFNSQNVSDMLLSLLNNLKSFYMPNNKSSSTDSSNLPSSSDILTSNKNKVVIRAGSNLNHIRSLIKYKQRYDILGIVNETSDAVSEFGVKHISLSDFMVYKNKYDNLQLILYSFNDLLKKDLNFIESLNLKLGEDWLFYELFENQQLIEYDLIKKWINLNQIKNLFDYLKNKKHKKITTIIGNCQTRLLSRLLASNVEFSKVYTIINIPSISDIDLERIDKDKFLFILDHADTIFTQYINPEFCQKLATDELKKHISNNQEIIVFSNLSFAGYFPQAFLNPVKSKKFLFKNSKIFPYNDNNIEFLYSKGFCFDVIYDKLSSINFYQKEIFLDFFQNQINVSKKRDSLCDIKFFEDISELLSSNILFYSIDHPHESLIVGLAKKILSYLSIKDLSFPSENDLCNAYSMNYQSQIVYPSVFNNLGLPFTYNNLYINKNLLPGLYSFKEYIELYYNYLCLSNSTN